jgi:ethanolamine utilization protein EutA (predicted chaperonin)
MSQYYTPVQGGAVPGNVPINFVTQAGTAVSAANTINIVGAGAATTSGAGSTVTITSTSTILPWNDINVDTTAAVNNGYFATAALTLTLPAAPTQGQVVEVYADVANAVNVHANTNQFIRIGNDLSAISGIATGIAVNNAQGDALVLVFRSATNTWMALSVTGTWGLV